MRVVAGSARGRRLRAPPGGTLRPTRDRVREAVFSMVASRDALAGAAVADLFAGTGALGIEALSRGASAATFVERDRTAVETIRANLASTGFAERATVVHGDVLRWLEEGRAVDLALVDPPYSFDAWERLAARLQAGLAVFESDRELDLGDRWDVLRVRWYGGTVVTIAHPMKGRP